MDLASKIFKGSRSIWIIFFILCVISVIEVYSATSTLAYKRVNYWIPVLKHAEFLMAGAFIAVVFHNFSYKLISMIAFIGIPISLIFLIYAVFLGKEINGASRWVSLFGVQFQPSEIAKFSSIVFTAVVLSRKSILGEKKTFYSIIALVGLFSVLILLDNFSTAFLLFASCFILMFIGQISLKRLGLFTVFMFLVLGTALGILFLIPAKSLEEGGSLSGLSRFKTWKARVERFTHGKETELDPKTYVITDNNLQVTHAKIALAKGGLLGKMPGHGEQRDFLPQAYSDFIFAIIVEEMGVIGALVVILLYVWLLIKVGTIARKCDKLLPKYLVIGCGIVITLQALANMAVAVDMIPVTGQPLPLISRGGTSTLITCAYFGIILSVSRTGTREEEELSDDEKEGEEIVDFVSVDEEK